MRQGNSLMRTKLWTMGAVALALLLLGSVAESAKRGGPKTGMCKKGRLICHVTKKGKVIPICGNHSVGAHGGDFAPLTVYRDGDGDGFGTSASKVRCKLPGGFAVMDGDCDDGDGAINPGAAEVCDGVDNDCVGGVDDGNPGSGGTCNTGLDGVCAAGTEQCVAGSIACEQDVLPSAEICDGLDNDCVGGVDDGITLASSGATRFEDLSLTVFDCATDLEWEKKLAATDALCTGGTPDVRCVGNLYRWSAEDPFLAPTGTAFTVFLPGLDGFAGIPACTTTSVCEAPFPDGAPVTCTTDPPNGCWRLPEIDEQRTILTTEFPICPDSPAIDPIFGPTAPSFYYSATSGDFGPFDAWGVSFSACTVVDSFKFNNSLVRAVRSSP